MSIPLDERTADDRIETLIAEDVIEHDEETDVLTTTDDFEEHRHVYYDSYLELDEAEFHDSVAEVFDLDSREAAAERVEELGVDREEFATYLTLSARLEGYDAGELAEMAALAVEIGPSSPVPESVRELDDDAVADFIADNEWAIVTVWKRGCAPCDGMKDDLDEILAALPDRVAVAGVDGEACPEFCRTHEVNAAPAVVFFEAGERRDVVTGRTSPEPLADRARTLYALD